MYQPLADLLRPQTLDEVYGQEHILGKGAVLRRLIDSGNIPNMVFYGPSGTGKTTVANIIAKQTNRTLYKLNATTASTADIKEIVAQLDTFMAPNGVLLYLDEIQSFNKKQQQSLLEHIENGKITLIASTTENPYFYVFNAILSRSTVFEFKQISASAALQAVRPGGFLHGAAHRADRRSRRWGAGIHRILLRRRPAQGHERGGGAVFRGDSSGREASPDPGGRQGGHPEKRPPRRPGRG